MPQAPVNTLSDRIDAWLPQTQCTRCGYPRCRDYADAVADGRADINRCPPGGEITLRALADLLGTPTKPLDPECGAHQPRQLAVIDESVCIGCRKCIVACPVDAIVGAPKLMHTVIASECNGCGLCVPPCPVDCIDLPPIAGNPQQPWPDYSAQEAAHWRTRTERRLARLAQRKKKTSAPRTASIFPDSDAIRADIRAAVERAKQRKTKRGR
jgi:electron transport complex protein RnfB